LGNTPWRFRLLFGSSLLLGAELFLNTKRREDYAKKIFTFCFGEHLRFFGILYSTEMGKVKYFEEFLASDGRGFFWDVAKG